jgi:hypothetical protein
LLPPFGWRNHLAARAGRPDLTTKKGSRSMSPTKSKKGQQATLAQANADARRVNAQISRTHDQAARQAAMAVKTVLDGHPVNAQGKRARKDVRPLLTER